MREMSQDDLVIRACRHLGIQPVQLFMQFSQNFTNKEEVHKYRFLRWLKYGELTPAVREYCERELKAHTQVRSDEEESGWLFT